MSWQYTRTVTVKCSNFSIIFEYRHRFIIKNKIFDKICSSSSTCDHKFKVGTIVEHPCCSMSLRNSKFRILRTRIKTDVRRPRLWYDQVECREISKFPFSSRNCHFWRKITKMMTSEFSDIYEVWFLKFSTK